MLHIKQREENLPIAKTLLSSAQCIASWFGWVLVQLFGNVGLDEWSDLVSFKLCPGFFLKQNFLGRYLGSCTPSNWVSPYQSPQLFCNILCWQAGTCYSAQEPALRRKKMGLEYSINVTPGAKSSIWWWPVSTLYVQKAPCTKYGPEPNSSAWLCFLDLFCELWLCMSLSSIVFQFKTLLTFRIFWGVDPDLRFWYAGHFVCDWGWLFCLL